MSQVGVVDDDLRLRHLHYKWDVRGGKFKPLPTLFLVVEDSTSIWCLVPNNYTRSTKVNIEGESPLETIHVRQPRRRKFEIDIWRIQDRGKFLTLYLVGRVIIQGLFVTDTISQDDMHDYLNTELIQSISISALVLPNHILLLDPVLTYSYWDTTKCETALRMATSTTTNT